jgi:hypothetical protein
MGKANHFQAPVAPALSCSAHQTGSFQDDSCSLYILSKKKGNKVAPDRAQLYFPFTSTINQKRKVILKGTS